MTLYDMGQNPDFCLYRHRLCLENRSTITNKVKMYFTVVFPLAPEKGMVNFSRKGHFQRAATCKEGTFKRAATCKEGTFKPASFIFSPVLSSFTFLSQFTNPLEAGCCYCQPFKQKTLKKNLFA